MDHADDRGVRNGQVAPAFGGRVMIDDGGGTANDNGYESRPLLTSAVGVRQGCNLAAILYLFVPQPSLLSPAPSPLSGSASAPLHALCPLTMQMIHKFTSLSDLPPPHPFYPHLSPSNVCQRLQQYGPAITAG